MVTPQHGHPGATSRCSLAKFMIGALVVITVWSLRKSGRPVSSIYQSGVGDGIIIDLDVNASVSAAADHDDTVDAETIPLVDAHVNDDPISDYTSEPKLPVVLVPFVSSSQVGASWLLSMLSRTYPHLVCAPSMDNLLDPSWERLSEGAHWKSEANECSFAFLRDGIQAIAAQLVKQFAAGNPKNCSATDCFNATFVDLLHEQLDLLCPWVTALNQTNYTTDDILNQWITEYLRSEGSIVWRRPEPHPCRQCASPTGADAPFRGLTIMSEWLPRWPFDAPWNPVSINLNSTILSGSKMIYVHRSNLLARFLETEYGRQSQGTSATQPWIQIDTEYLLTQFTWMEYLDTTSLAWVNDHVAPSGALVVDYDDCRANNVNNTCLSQVLEYLGVKPSAKWQPAEDETAHSVHTNDNALGILDEIINIDEVKEVVYANGYKEFLGESVEPYAELLLLLYESDPTISRSRPFPGIRLQQYSTNDEDESKWDRAKSLLAKFPSNRLVVLGNSQREVSFLFSYTALVDFKANLLSMTNGGGIVVSTGQYCCMPDLSFLSPGDLVASDGSRSSRADNCHFNTSCSEAILAEGGGDARTRVWREFMENLAATRRLPSVAQAWYLDSGLLAGTAGELYRVLSLADIGPTEDATSVLTDLMYLNNTLIQLDYTQQFFGRYRLNPLNASTQQVCTSAGDSIIQSPRQNFSNAKLTKALLRQKSELECHNSHSTLRMFPVWNSSGIVLSPILDHISRVASSNGTLAGIDTSFGPEIPYIFDEKGLWTFSSIRNRTDPGVITWRQRPIEEIMKRGFHLVMDRAGSSKWPALRKSLQSGGFPFFAWYGDFKGCSSHNFDEASIPVLTNSATVTCAFAFPTPSYQQTFDMRTDRFYFLFQAYSSKYPLQSKIPKVVWRGTLSGNNPSKVFETIRWRLCAKVHALQSDQFDVGLTTIPNHNKRAEQNISMVGGLASYISPMEDFQKYAAILDMDGNSWSSRFGTLLCYNSVVIKVEPEFVDYFYYDIKPWTHFVPVRNDLSDLFSTVAYVLDPSNADVIHDIVTTANSWCAARFNPTQLAHDMVDVFESYVRKLDQIDSTWSDDWTEKKDHFLSELDIAEV